MDGLMIMQGDDGVFREYSDEYDVTIHFEKEKDRDEFIGQTQWCDVDEALPIPGEYVLLSFANYPVPMVGRYEEDEDGGGNFYVGDDDVPLVKQDIFVNGWRLLPKCMEE